jgi:hypothetical protein
MATTTNYGWTTPDDTALVKDGAAAIRTLGSSVDTTTKALNPETTLGDLAYRSSTANVKTRLGLGTAGQVLQVNSGATAPEWATLAPPVTALTKITSGSFSNVASVDIDSLFSSTYKNYFMVLKTSAATSANALHLQLRYGSTTRTATYYYSAFKYYNDNTLTTYGSSGAASQLALSNSTGGSGTPSVFNIYFNNVGIPSVYPYMYGNGFTNESIANFACWQEDQQTYTGVRIKSSSSNVTGEYFVYGLAN